MDLKAKILQFISEGKTDVEISELLLKEEGAKDSMNENKTNIWGTDKQE